MEVHFRKSVTSLVTIEKMRSTFATFGLLEQLVTDNGPSFTRVEFQQFMQCNGVRTSPYHPASNGLVVRAVQTFQVGNEAGTRNTGSSTVPVSVLLPHHPSCHNRATSSRADAWSTTEDTLRRA